jgi:hypothetical protein
MSAESNEVRLARIEEIVKNIDSKVDSFHAINDMVHKHEVSIAVIEENEKIKIKVHQWWLTAVAGTCGALMSLFVAWIKKT